MPVTGDLVRPAQHPTVDVGGAADSAAREGEVAALRVMAGGVHGCHRRR